MRACSRPSAADRRLDTPEGFSVSGWHRTEIPRANEELGWINLCHGRQSGCIARRLGWSDQRIA
jgi:hypothetical protein